MIRDFSVGPVEHGIILGILCVSGGMECIQLPNETTIYVPGSSESEPLSCLSIACILHQRSGTSVRRKAILAGGLSKIQVQ